MFNGKIHYKWPFSIAMLVYQRVIWFWIIGDRHPKQLLMMFSASRLANSCYSLGCLDFLDIKNITPSGYPSTNPTRKPRFQVSKDLGGAIYSSSNISNSNPIHAISVISAISAISQLQPSHSSICWKDNFVPGSCPETRLPGGNLRSTRPGQPIFPAIFPGFLWPCDP